MWIAIFVLIKPKEAFISDGFYNCIIILKILFTEKIGTILEWYHFAK